MVLIGRAGGDAVMRGSEEKPVALFQLATSQSFKTPEGMCLCLIDTIQSILYWYGRLVGHKPLVV